MVRVVGGGCLNRFLCQMTADACGRKVIAGPVEAAALGNAMVQAVATGHLTSLADGREALKRSVQYRVVFSCQMSTWQEAFERYQVIVVNAATWSMRPARHEINYENATETVEGDEMASYAIPEVVSPEPVAQDEVILVANGDLRQSANEVCWAAQAGLEEMLTAAFLEEGIKVRRAHPYDPALKHGFIHGQRMGMDVFEHIHPEAPLVVAEAVWQYSGHLWAGLRFASRSDPHRRQLVRTVARPGWHVESQWLSAQGRRTLQHAVEQGLQGSLFKKGLQQWIKDKVVVHDTSHVHEFVPGNVGEAERALGGALAKELQSKKAILGVFDEGCMGMMNAIIEDALMNPGGIYKERLSQSALYAAMREVTAEEAQKIRNWLDAARNPLRHRRE